MQREAGLSARYLASASSTAATSRTQCVIQLEDAAVAAGLLELEAEAGGYQTKPRRFIDRKLSCLFGELAAGDGALVRHRSAQALCQSASLRTPNRRVQRTVRSR
jgi:hypothetical protein